MKNKIFAYFLITLLVQPVYQLNAMLIKAEKRHVGQRHYVDIFATNEPHERHAELVLDSLNALSSGTAPLNTTICICLPSIDHDNKDSFCYELKRALETFGFDLSPFSTYESQSSKIHYEFSGEEAVISYDFGLVVCKIDGRLTLIVRKTCSPELDACDLPDKLKNRLSIAHYMHVPTIMIKEEECLRNAVDTIEPNITLVFHFDETLTLSTSTHESTVVDEALEAELEQFVGALNSYSE